MTVIERCSSCKFLQEFDENCGILKRDHRFVTDEQCEAARKRHAQGIYLAKKKKREEDQWR